MPTSTRAQLLQKQLVKLSVLGSASRRRRRSTSVPATNSPTYHRPPGVDTSALPNGNGLRTATTAAGTSVPVQQQAPPVVPSLPGLAGQLPVLPGASVNQELARQMLQAQDDQIRQQSAQIAQMTVLLQQALELANANARAAAATAAGPVVNTFPTGGEAAATTT